MLAQSPSSLEVLVKLNRFHLEVVPELHEHVNVEKLRDQGSVRSPRLWNPFQKHRIQVEVHHRPVEARVPQMFLLKFIIIRNFMFMTIGFKRLPLVLTLLTMVDDY